MLSLTRVLFESQFLRANVITGLNVQSKQTPCFLTEEHDQWEGVSGSSWSYSTVVFKLSFCSLQNCHVLY